MHYIHTYITLHYITLHYTTLHYITLHYIHTYMHTYIHYIHTYITYIRTYVRTYVRTYIHTYIHTYIMYIYIYIHIITWYMQIKTANIVPTVLWLVVDWSIPRCLHHSTGLNHSDTSVSPTLLPVIKSGHSGRLEPLPRHSGMVLPVYASHFWWSWGWSS